MTGEFRDGGGWGQAVGRREVLTSGLLASIWCSISLNRNQESGGYHGSTEIVSYARSGPNKLSPEPEKTSLPSSPRFSINTLAHSLGFVRISVRFETC